MRFFRKFKRAATSADIAYYRELGHEPDPETGLDPWRSATLWVGVSNGIPDNRPVKVTLAAQITAVPEASVSILMGGASSPAACAVAGDHAWQWHRRFQRHDS